MVDFAPPAVAKLLQGLGTLASRGDTTAQAIVDSYASYAGFTDITPSQLVYLRDLQRKLFTQGARYGHRDNRPKGQRYADVVRRKRRTSFASQGVNVSMANIRRLPLISTSTCFGPGLEAINSAIFAPRYEGPATDYAPLYLWTLCDGPVPPPHPVNMPVLIAVEGGTDQGAVWVRAARTHAGIPYATNYRPVLDGPNGFTFVRQAGDATWLATVRVGAVGCRALGRPLPTAAGSFTATSVDLEKGSDPLSPWGRGAQTDPKVKAFIPPLDESVPYQPYFGQPERVDGPPYYVYSQADLAFCGDLEAIAIGAAPSNALAESVTITGISNGDDGFSFEFTAVPRTAEEIYGVESAGVWSTLVDAKSSDTSPLVLHGTATYDAAAPGGPAWRTAAVDVDDTTHPGQVTFWVTLDAANGGAGPVAGETLLTPGYCEAVVRYALGMPPGDAPAALIRISDITARNIGPSKAVAAFKPPPPPPDWLCACDDDPLQVSAESAV